MLLKLPLPLSLRDAGAEALLLRVGLVVDDTDVELEVLKRSVTVGLTLLPSEDVTIDVAETKAVGEGELDTVDAAEKHADEVGQRDTLGECEPDAQALAVRDREGDLLGDGHAEIDIETRPVDVTNGVLETPLIVDCRDAELESVQHAVTESDRVLDALRVADTLALSSVEPDGVGKGLKDVEVHAEPEAQLDTTMDRLDEPDVDGERRAEVLTLGDSEAAGDGEDDALRDAEGVSDGDGAELREARTEREPRSEADAVNEAVPHTDGDRDGRKEGLKELHNVGEVLREKELTEEPVTTLALAYPESDEEALGLALELAFPVAEREVARDSDELPDEQALGDKDETSEEVTHALALRVAVLETDGLLEAL